MVACLADRCLRGLGTWLLLLGVAGRVEPLEKWGQDGLDRLAQRDRTGLRCAWVEAELWESWT